MGNVFSLIFILMLQTFPGQVQLFLNVAVHGRFEVPNSVGPIRSIFEQQNFEHKKVIQIICFGNAILD